MPDSSIWQPEPNNFEDRCDEALSPDNRWDSNLDHNFDHRRLVPEEQNTDPWEWAYAIQRQKINETWEGRIVESWTTRDTYIALCMLFVIGGLLAAILRTMFWYEMVEAIVVSGYGMATVTAAILGWVLALQLR
ncbi:hypothetical protein DL98DRAFT_534678 [Cadophora sp. DSE1049]|nr:hypothetical protein DL98DRAFT_534678 [Cadophora sp. DSE1049]